MGHEIDLKKLDLRTDLAIEAISQVADQGSVKQKFTVINGIKVSEVEILKNGGAAINKKDGKYITIEFDDITDHDNEVEVRTIFSKYLKVLLKHMKIKEDATCLIVGLGNSRSTPDALGPLTIEQVLVTNHLFEYGEVEDGFRAVATLTPGVMGQTGVETSDLISSLVDKIHPDFCIFIDALASQSIERVNRTIQMTDTGIHPGSGVGNARKELSKEILGVPVLAIGVPTVVDAATIVSDTIHYMQQHFSYMKKHMDDPVHKLSPLSQVNYLEHPVEVTEEEKTNLFGFIGKLTDREMKQLAFEALAPIGYNMIVTPKEVDFMIEKLSRVIGSGMNQALHKKIKNK